MSKDGLRVEVNVAILPADTPLTNAFFADWYQQSPEADFARSLERRLSLAQTEIKGHMRVEDAHRKNTEAQARIAELEKDAARYQAQLSCSHEFEYFANITGSAAFGRCRKCGYTK